MITGAHSIIYSTDPEADRAFIREVFFWYPQPPMVRLLPIFLTVVAGLGWVLSMISAARQDAETRCRSCGHILRGLTEPRCPECGEPI